MTGRWSIAVATGQFYFGRTRHRSGQGLWYAAAMGVDLIELGLLGYVDGFPRPDWEAIAKHAPEAGACEQGYAFYCDVARQWTGELARCLGGGYRVHESAHCTLISWREEADAQQVLRLCKHCRERILDILDGAGWSDGEGKHVIVDFEDVDDMHAYVEAVSGEPGGGAYAGMCLREGYVHMVFSAGSWGAIESTICHEMAHVLLSHRQLPSWIDEGIASMMESQVARRPRGAPCVPALCHGASFLTLTPFWSGGGFTQYATVEEGSAWRWLAAELVRVINDADPSRFGEFLKAARPEDAGEEACRAIYLRSLEDFVTLLIGPGPWAPLLGQDKG